MKIKLIKLLLVFSSLFCLITEGFSQDAHFTQAYAAPLYLNPAFTGVTRHSRLVSNTRQQWAATPANYITTTFSYDRNLRHLKSGVGLLASLDKAGTGNLKNVSIGALYGYQINLNRDKWIIRSGLNFSYSSVSVDYQKLTFGDQLSIDGKVFDKTTDSQGRIQRSNYFDLSGGLLTYSKNVWVGTAVRHLNQPNQAVIGNNSKVPYLLSIHGGAKIPMVTSYKVKQEISLLPTFQYKAQDKYDQVDLGLYLYYEPMIFGLWYRGLPGLKKYDVGFPNHDAFALLLGYKYMDFKVGYSYDITVSKLSSNTAGSHEISLTYEFSYEHKRRKPKRRDMRVICPMPQL